MVRLTQALQAWGAPDFRDVLKAEIEGLDVDQLPLQQALAHSSAVTDHDRRVLILGVEEGEECITARAGIFYTGVIAGCNCADDPTPVEDQNEYCEVRLTISKTTAEAAVELLDS